MPSSSNFTGLSSLKDETVVLKDYVIGQRLGEGSYGSVYLATYVPSGERFAIKIMQNNCFSGCVSQVIQEATVMQSLEHPHVARLYKFLQSTAAFYFVMELAEGGELFDLIISKHFFKEADARRYFQQLMSAIDYCHSNGVAHRDLKAENLLLTKDNKLLVCDFGLSSKRGSLICVEDNASEEVEIEQPIGTLHYISPEMVSRDNSAASRDPFLQDLWSAGVILFFMLTGRLPFDGRCDDETLHIIQRGEFSFTEEEKLRISDSALSLVLRMLALEPTDRPTSAQIIEDEWFGINLEATVFPHRETVSSSSIFLNFSREHRVTPEEEAVLKVAFQKVDIDGYGRITRDQIRDMLTTLHGEKVSAADVSELIQLFTGDENSNFITYEQFCDAWVRKDLAHRPFKLQCDFQLNKIIGTRLDEVEREVVRQLRTAFDSVDDLHTGVINVDKWRRLFARCKICVTDEEIKSLMRFFDQHDVESTGEITFDKFLVGIVKREMLVRHPMGQKLAAATNLAALLQSRKVSECVRHGFVVVGLESAVVEKLVRHQQRLVLLYNDDIVSETENVYSFRYICSSALTSGKTAGGATPLLRASGNGLPLTPGGVSPPENIRLSSSLNRCSKVSKLSTSLRNGSSSNNTNNNNNNNTNNNNTTAITSTTTTTTTGTSAANGATTRRGNNLPMTSLNISTRAAVSQTHRALAFGGVGTVSHVNGVCDLDVILAPASLGYTLVRFLRIYGNTLDFHEAVMFISSMLEKERQQAIKDMLPCGESELV